MGHNFRITARLFAAFAAAAAVSAQASPPEPRQWRPVQLGKTYSQVAESCRSWASSDKAYADCINVQWSLIHSPSDARDAAQKRLDTEYPRKPTR